MPLILTIDLGTTLFKLAVFDEQGNTRALRRVSPPIVHRNPGWVEIEPAAFKGSIIETVTQLHADLGDDWNDIVAVSFASQANSFVLSDANGHELTPIILWNDNRAASMEAELRRLDGVDEFAATTGVPRLSPQFAAAKLLWLQTREPSLSRSARQFASISDYFTHWMSGQSVTEAGVAALTGGVDIRTRRWRPEFWHACGFPEISLPRIVRSGTQIDRILELRVEELKLPRSCRFVIGCLDQYAGAIGTGTIAPGRVTETTGTVLSAVCTADALMPNPPPEVFQGPGFDEGTFFRMCFSSTSANVLDWYRHQLADPPSYQGLAAMAADVPSAAGGEGVVIEPVNDSAGIARSFQHVRPEHTPGQVTRAIYERVALSLRHQVRTLLAGQEMPDRIVSAGGGAHSDVWLQIKADTLRIPFVASKSDEPASLGAAMLAARAMGFGSLNDLAGRWVRERAVFTPR
jgi:sugar (pentulose or hexulose) kinase